MHMQWDPECKGELTAATQAGTEDKTKSWQDFGSLREVQSRLSTVSEHMTLAFECHSAEWGTESVSTAARHVLGRQGKMIRAVIVLEACRAVGGDPELLTAAAAGVEYGHLASLVHDDLIDGDIVRRSQATVWHNFGAWNAVVTGDLLIFEAFHALADCRAKIPAERIVRALETMARSGIDACFGASLEVKLTGDIQVEPETYLKMAKAKTGSLLRASAEGGAILGGGSTEELAAFRDYGEKLGTAFQIIDDLLPYVSDEQTAGKSIYSDIRNRRPTLPILYAFGECTDDERSFLSSVFSTPELSDSAVEQTYDLLMRVLSRTGALANALRLASEYRDASLASLSGISSNEGIERLRALVHIVFDRNLR